MELRAKVLTVSDGVVAGRRENRSGAALLSTLEAAGFVVVANALVDLLYAWLDPRVRHA